MERLTEKVFAFNGTSCMQIKDCDNDTCDQTCRSRTGSEGCEGCPIQIAIDKLAEYEDLEEQNRLLKLPCAVGDTVYIVKGGEVLRNYVVQIHIAQVEAQTFFSCYDDCFGIEQIGKTVFLTREESEASLKELDSGKGE